jgi:hypothetical protein
LRALQITEKPLEYLCEADAWGALPYDLATIAAWNLGFKQDALAYSAQALNFSPNDARLKGNHEMILSELGQRKVDVIIPTKSNLCGLDAILQIAQHDESVASIHVIADGEDSFAQLNALNFGNKVHRHVVPLGSGIHVMWNLGMASSSEFNHVLFLNDDVSIDNETIGSLASQLNADSSIGLICPNYDSREISGPYQAVSTTCRGRYDGSGGLAGFCMMLASDLRSTWRFDERMKWWYGDDDLARWVRSIRLRKVAIASNSTCSDNCSWTVKNDPPADFAEIVERDRVLFMLKWGENAS